MGDRQQLRFALAALLAGLAWGYLRHRHGSRVLLHSCLQGLEWFVAYGGAAALVELTRHRLEPDDEATDEPEAEDAERITRFRQVVTEQAAP